MGRVSCAINEFRFSRLLVTIFVREVEYSEKMVILIQRHVLKLADGAGLLVSKWQRYRDRPGHAVCQSHVGTDCTVVGSIQKSFKRRISACGNHFQIRNFPRAQPKCGHASGGFNQPLAFSACHFPVNQRAPVGPDKFHANLVLFGVR